MKQVSIDTPLVSIIMNCYNGENYLHRSIPSVLAQTYQNWELIFWDNASTDHSKEIFDSYAQNDGRFKYFRSKENVSLGQARAWAVDACTGDYIAILDVDDEWIPEKTEIQIKDLLSNDYIMSYGGVVEIDEENPERRRDRIPPYKSGPAFADQLMNFEMYLPTAVIKRSALKEKKLNFDPFIQASEEYCLFMQLIYDEETSVFQIPLANYYVRNDSLSNKCIDRWYIERNYTLDRIVEAHPEALEKYKKGFDVAYARGKYYQSRLLMFKGDKKGARRLLKSILSIDYRYVFLYVLTFFPVSLWNYVHYKKNMR